MTRTRTPTAHRTGGRPGRTALLATLGLLGLLGLGLLGACAGADQAQDSSVGGEAAVEAGSGAAHGQDAGGAGDEEGEAAADQAPGTAEGASAPVAGWAGRPVASAAEHLVYEASLTVRVDDVEAAAARAEQLTGAAEGYVFAEESWTQPELEEESRSELTVRVPPERFRPLLGQLAGLGDRLEQTQSAQDVTDEVVDVESRIASQQESVARIRALLAEAERIADVVTIEGELASRQAELESLQSRLASLQDRTAYATITLALVGPGAEAPAEEEDRHGFLAGLEEGWEAFTASVAVTLTVLGALLPFAVAGAVLAVPVWLVLRRRQVRTSASPAAAAEAAAAGPRP